MKYFIIAGEASGDLHASALMNELKIKDNQAEFAFYGGELMQLAGGKMKKHFREMAFMGFWGVLKNFNKVIRNFKDCKNDIRKFKPDLVILVDYPGFNLKMAKFIHNEIKVPVYYYISPKLWAWKSYRIRQIKKYVTKMLTIFPFETEYFARFNYKVNYVGNPVVDSISVAKLERESDQIFKRKNFLSEKPILALLPGSRKQEISNCLPKMLEAVKKYKNYQIVISGALGIEVDFYYQFMDDDRVPVTMSQTQQLLLHADVAVVNSGTATLETALAGTPQVVVYFVMFGRLAYWLKPLLIKTKFISLVNILAGKEVVKELYAHLFNINQIQNELDRIITEKEYLKKMKENYQKLADELGQPGSVYRAVTCILEDFKI